MRMLTLQSEAELPSYVSHFTLQVRLYHYIDHLLVLVFFIGYVIFEIPSNIVIRKIGPANWLSFIALAWGGVSIGIGFCDSWIPLAVCRALLGILEAVC